MKVSLHPESRQTMCFIGKVIYLTSDEPGPIEVEAQKLTPDERRQVILNYNRKVLQIDGYAELAPPETVAEQSIVVPPSLEVPPLTPTVNVMGQVLKDDKIPKREQIDINKILKGTLESVKKDVVSLPPNLWHRCIQLEKKGKARRSLILFFQELITAHEKAVATNITKEEAASPIPFAEPAHLANLPEVVSSEGTEVTVTIPSDEELNKG